jgi:hypothetical protein
MLLIEPLHIEALALPARLARNGRVLASEMSLKMG